MKRVRSIFIALAPPSADSPYYDLARSWKVELYFANLVETQGMTLPEFREQGISPLDYNAYIFSGRQAVDHFFRLMQEMRLEVPADSRFLCVGEAVAQHLYQYIPGALRRRTYAQAHSLDELIPYMRKHPQSKYLYVGGGAAPLHFFGEAAKYNIPVATVRVYHVRYLPLPAELRRKRFSVLCFSSPTSVLAWKHLHPRYKQGETAILVFGQDTLRVAQAEGLHVTDYAPRGEISSLLALLVQFLRNAQGRSSALGRD
ncbi:MAG: uroporphyrinogen-III synthase [Bacteroidia bacterium]|nr:uroporphyrinogen-III synthase [Bacteroidia bacterium]GIV23930.1 MAG: uroporphyrinogen III methyltransferase [Bacteroidia bacterium]